MGARTPHTSSAAAEVWGFWASWEPELPTPVVRSGVSASGVDAIATVARHGSAATRGAGVPLGREALEPRDTVRREASAGAAAPFTTNEVVERGAHPERGAQPSAEAQPERGAQPSVEAQPERGAQPSAEHNQAGRGAQLVTG